MLEPPDVRLLERSLDAFRQGLLGLIPAIGVVWSIAALRSHVQARASRGRRWNAAGHLSKAGFILGLAGLGWFALQTLAVAGLVLAHSE